MRDYTNSKKKTKQHCRMLMHHDWHLESVIAVQRKGAQMPPLLCFSSFFNGGHKAKSLLFSGCFIGASRWQVRTKAGSLQAEPFPAEGQRSASLGGFARSGPGDGGLCRGLLPRGTPRGRGRGRPLAYLGTQHCLIALAALRDGCPLPPVRHCKMIFPFSFWTGPGAEVCAVSCQWQDFLSETQWCSPEAGTGL